MKKDITVAAEKRDSRGKNEARRLRVRGSIPAVVYGAGQDAVPVSVDPAQLTHILRSSTGHNTIFSVDIAGESAPVMIVDWQEEPLRGHLLHVDLKRIDLTHRLKVKIPVQLRGEARGVKQQGGLLEVVTREVEIECLPDEIPEHFDLDVTSLMLGQNLRASDIAVPESIKLVSSPDSVIAHIIAIRGTEEAAPAEAVAAAEPAQPEVIKKGKKEEEAEAAAEKGKKK
jgi:large subunit ribosomal protein L25